MSFSEIEADLRELYGKFLIGSWQVKNLEKFDDGVSARFKNGRITIRAASKQDREEWKLFLHSLRKSAIAMTRHQSLRDQISNHLHHCRDERQKILAAWDEALQPVLDWAEEK